MSINSSINVPASSSLKSSARTPLATARSVRCVLIPCSLAMTMAFWSSENKIPPWTFAQASAEVSPTFRFFRSTKRLANSAKYLSSSSPSTAVVSNQLCSSTETRPGWSGIPRSISSITARVVTLRLLSPVSRSRRSSRPVLAKQLRTEVSKTRIIGESQDRSRPSGLQGGELFVRAGHPP